MPDYPSPCTLGLPHDSWRPHQYETYQWLKEQKGVVFCEAVCGSGKTGLATALASDYTVTSLCKTKNLQVVNYGGIYDWSILQGRKNYACAQHLGLFADECPEAESGMGKCEGAERCPYLIAKRKVQGSRKASLNYSYWLAARWVRQEQYLPQVLVCDEADELPDLVADWAGCTITERDRQNWGLPVFPYLSGVDDPTSGTDSVSIAVDWLERSREILGRAWRVYEHPSNPKEKQLRDRVEELGQKVRNTLDCLQANSSDWFIRSGPTARQFNGDYQPAFICRPLTARYHWGRYFNVAQTTVLMSATIGQPEPLARELGIEEFQFRSVPSQWPPEMRPVLCPGDAPALGRKAEPSAYEKQADIAAKLLKECDPNWFGIVLVTSKAEAQAVAQRLAKRGYEDRVWVIPEKEHGQWVGTDRQTELWQQRKRSKPGSIMVSYNHWRGYDGLDEKILLVCKTPYPRMGQEGSFESAYMRYDGKRYHWRTANLLMQGCGRTRRGREEDYGAGNGLVAILDSNWSKVRKNLSDDFKSAIIQ